MNQPHARIWYTSRANRDVDEAADWLDRNAGASVAVRFLDALEHTLALLERSPQMGTPCHHSSLRHSGLRRIPLSGNFNVWMLYYTPSQIEIRIDRVFHSSRHTKSLFPKR